ncbi:MAG: RagB/SusD family nutrient uptake outer membrane protein, partial [Bacteroidota bacterium]|nr:RagB/SusD family nutrient uptake outer membrane protein [Bacteroidota bacterium]
AEALAALNLPDEAVIELNKVRNRAAIGDYKGAKDKQSVEKEIFNERFRELWFELKRWPDIVRFHYGGTIDAYKIVPNLTGKTIPLFFPIPAKEINVNSNLKQTEGY